MKLDTFILSSMEAILASWEEHALTLVPLQGTDKLALRDHAEDILRAVVADMQSEKFPPQRRANSNGAEPGISPDRTPAETHALLRAKSGLNIEQLVAEYRALRASVLQKFADTGVVGPTTLSEVGRFNEAIDQAIAESVSSFAAETERWRNVFLGVLGHDLRGPLNAILMSVRLISRLSHDEPVLETTQRVVRSGERMRELLDDLLKYSRTLLGTGIPVHRKQVDVAAVCKEEVSQLSQALPACTVVYEGPDKLMAYVDPLRIKQVVSNLVINASKYGDVSKPVTMRLASTLGETTIEVENYGEQIPVATSEKMFELAQRGDDPQPELARTSLGLGLFIVREVARGHGGSVRSEHRQGRNVFAVRLPASPDQDPHDR